MYACMYTFTISLWWSFCAPVSKKWISLALFVVCRANSAVYGRVFGHVFWKLEGSLAHTRELRTDSCAAHMQSGVDQTWDNLQNSDNFKLE